MGTGTTVEARSIGAPAVEHNGTRPDGPHAPEGNRLLRSLAPESYARLLPLMEPVYLPAKYVLWEPEAAVEAVYFPRTCVLSIVVPLDGEKPVEAATVGCEGLAGVSVALGGESSSTRAFCQIPGDAMRIEAGAFRSALAADPALQRLTLRYAQALFEQAARAAACNARHEVQERCARWILMTYDRVAANPIPLTHEFLSIMLGVRRASVTVAVGALAQAGLVRGSRARIYVLDRAGLEAASCECYTVVARRYDRLLSG